MEKTKQRLLQEKDFCEFKLKNPLNENHEKSLEAELKLINECLAEIEANFISVNNCVSRCKNCGEEFKPTPDEFCTNRCKQRYMRDK